MIFLACLQEVICKHSDSRSESVPARGPTTTGTVGMSKEIRVSVDLPPNGDNDDEAEKLRAALLEQVSVTLCYFVLHHPWEVQEFVCLGLSDDSVLFSQTAVMSGLPPVSDDILRRCFMHPDQNIFLSNTNTTEQTNATITAKWSGN